MKREREMTGLQLQSSQRGAVIVAVDANRTTGSMEAVEWALKYIVKPGDVLLILGVFTTCHAKNTSSAVEWALKCDELAEKLEWGARWSIALEIGGSLRYLHEERVDEPIVHKNLCNFIHAEWLNGIFSLTKALIYKYDESYFGDVYDYGKFLLELITGKCVSPLHDQGKDPMIEWALPLLENGEFGKLMTETAGDARVVRHMAHAALRCLNVDSDHKLSISEALAIVRRDELAIFNH